MARPPHKIDSHAIRLSPFAAAVIFAIVSTAFLAFRATAVHDDLETRFSLSVYFRAREMLGLAPPLDPKLKIFAYDDTSFARYGVPDFPLETWAKLLTSIDERAPKAVFIDKLFSLPPGAAASDLPAIAALEKLRSRVVTTAFVIPNAINYREPLRLDGPLYRLSTYFRGPRAVSLMLDGFAPMSTVDNLHPYGPDRRLLSVFRWPGHSLNAGFGKAMALVDLGKGLVLPHMSLMGADSLSFERRHLVLQDDAGRQQIPVDEHGRMIVDYPSVNVLAKRTQRLLPLLDAAKAGEPQTKIAAGDTVLILPAMFTGNTDFTITPLGPMPGPYVVASLINSVLRRSWVAPFEGDPLLIVGAAAAGVVATGLFGSGSWFLALALLTGLMAGSVAAFAYASLLVDLITPALAFVVGALTASGVRSGMREKLMLFMRVLKTENDKLALEIEQAGHIASAFRPEPPPAVLGLDIGTFYKPLDRASGDWFAFETSPSGRFLHFIMCDISGHGVQAAIIVSTCKTVLSLLKTDHVERLDDETFLTHYMSVLNATLYKHGKGHHTTTMVGVTFDRQTGRCLTALAGHPPPFHLSNLRGAGAPHLAPVLATHNILGIGPNFEATPCKTVLKRGDHLIVYTDGIKFPRHSRRMASKLFEIARLKPMAAATKVGRQEWHDGSGRDRLEAPDDDMSLVWFACTDDWPRDAA